MKINTKSDLSQISSADLVYELSLREDIALIQWFSKSNLGELLEETNPTMEELESYLQHLRLNLSFTQRTSEEVREDFEDFRNSFQDQKQP